MGFSPSFETFPTLKETMSFLIPWKNQLKTQRWNRRAKYAQSRISSCVQIRWGRLMINLLFPVGALQRCWFGWTGVMKLLGGGNSNIFYFHLGEDSNLTNIFQRGWNHQLVMKFPFFGGNRMQTSVIGVQVVKKSSEKWLDDPGSEDTGHFFRELKGNSKVWKKTNPCESSLSTKNSMSLWIIPHPKNGQNSTKKDTLQFFVPIFGMVFKGCWWPPTRPRGIKGSRIESPGQLAGPRA